VSGTSGVLGVTVITGCAGGAVTVIVKVLSAESETGVADTFTEY
jgi:hypothetical protein